MHPKRFDGKFRGEICQFSGRKFEDFGPRFEGKAYDCFKVVDYQQLTKEGRKMPKM
jgi:hypothetical protein